MKFLNIKDFTNGWFIGSFEPSIFFSNEFEIGHLSLKKGHVADGHYHKSHVEINYIVCGKALIGDTILLPGDFFVYEPYDKSFVEYLEDTELIVIKNPAVKNDKFF